MKPGKHFYKTAEDINQFLKVKLEKKDRLKAKLDKLDIEIKDLEVELLSRPNYD